MADSFHAGLLKAHRDLGGASSQVNIPDVSATSSDLER